MYICLGNLTVEQIETRLGIELSEAAREELRSSRQEKATNIAANKWHCFDIPFMIECGSYEFAEKIKDLLTPYISEMKCPIRIGISEKEDKNA